MLEALFLQVFTVPLHTDWVFFFILYILVLGLHLA